MQANTPPRGGTRLYNVLFPIWLLILLPTAWLYILPANFVIDSAVVLITLALLYRARERRGDAQPLADKPNIWREWLRCILKVWIFGFLADLCGGGFMLFWGYVPGILGGEGAFGTWWSERVTDPISANPFTSVFAVLFAVAGVAVAGLAIYALDNRYALRKLSLSAAERKRAALALALITAPYAMLLPSEWFW